MYLNCHSQYSLRYGTISIENLVALAQANGLEYLALTDINCSTGVFDFIQACTEVNIKPIVGIEFRSEGVLKYIGLAKSLSGLRSLNELLTKTNLGEIPFSYQSPWVQDVIVIYPSHNIPTILQSHEYVGVRHWELSIYKNKFAAVRDKLICLNTVSYELPQHYELHKLLRCIDQNILLSQLETSTHGLEHDYMYSADAVQERYKHFPEVIQRTNSVADQCNIAFDYETPKNKLRYTGSYYEDKILLETLALEGFKERYGADNKVALERLYEELEVIDHLHFSCYFLTTWDIIRHSLSKGYFHVGRGSGANSLVAYCLKITEVDPLELNLYFARFLNRRRSSPPDFDIDWGWHTRDDIIDYIFKRFGREYTGFCGTVSQFKYRSIVRELGKVYGLPKEELDLLAYAKAKSHDQHDIIKKIQQYGTLLQGMPNQFSMHACGIFISEEPISTYTAMNAYQKGVNTCEIDMYIAESIHLEKLDILSQRGLGHISETINIVKENRGEQIDITKTDQFKKDVKCNKMLAEGKTLGCFYIESPAMRGLLRRLKCDTYEILVAASSIIRPGVAQSGMMREYIDRHRNPRKIEYFHKVFEDQLSDTYGVMVYQEDVIKIAHHFAKLDLDDADVLRRGMSGKSRSQKELNRIETQFFENCERLGYDLALSKEVYRQIQSFAGYSFCKSHSASYAIESYQSLYLKAYYPLEFITAVINNNGGFYRPEVYINEARLLGAHIEPPEINSSQMITSLKGSTIHLGLNQVISLSKKIQELIPKEREINGPFLTIQDLIKRTNVGFEEVSCLIYVGALRSFNLPKGQLIIDAKRSINNGSEAQTASLFEVPMAKFEFPEIEKDPIADAFDELEGLGYPVSISPFNLLKTTYRGDVLVKDILSYEGQTVKMLGYLISIKDVPIKKRNGQNVKMNFGTWIDVEGAYFDTTHFPDTLKKYDFKGLGCYLILGKVTVDFDMPSIEVAKMERLPMVPDPRFHEDTEKKGIWEGLPVAHSKTIRNPYPGGAERDVLFGRSDASNNHTFKGTDSPYMNLGGRR